MEEEKKGMEERKKMMINLDKSNNQMQQRRKKWEKTVRGKPWCRSGWLVSCWKKPTMGSAAYRAGPVCRKSSRELLAGVASGSVNTPSPAVTSRECRCDPAWRRGRRDHGCRHWRSAWSPPFSRCSVRRDCEKALERPDPTIETHGEN